VPTGKRPFALKKTSGHRRLMLEAEFRIPYAASHKLENIELNRRLERLAG
jgi:hypothetical protein